MVFMFENMGRDVWGFSAADRLRISTSVETATDPTAMGNRVGRGNAFVKAAFKLELKSPNSPSIGLPA
jgi:hypothetical protein